MMASFLNLGWPMTLIDAAARSILMALAVGIGLNAFRVTNVRARKVAWVLVLTGAVTMPLLAPWVESQAWLSARAAVVPLQTWVEQAKVWGRTTKQPDAPRPDRAVVAPYRSTRVADSETVTLQPQYRRAVVNSDLYPSPSTIMGPGRNSVETHASKPLREDINTRQLGFLAYFLIAGALLSRLAFGLIVALRLWLRAEPVEFDAQSSFGGDLPVRWCRDISSPVTVGSGILLPATHKYWDDEKLRIVLAHESSHVRQGDFYLQLCAGIYAAVFWFSPLGWWLKRTLCDLSEAVSDGAAVGQAATHASYAQVLLEFAAMPRTTRIGVAMARSGRLSHRIERLLDESNFRRAFAGGRARMLIAAMLAPLALFAATSLIRVEAAGQAPPTPAAPASPAALAGPAAPALPGSPAMPPEPAALAAPTSLGEIGAPPPAAPSAPAFATAPEAPPAPAAPEAIGLGASRGTGESYAMATSQSDSHSRSRGRSSTHMSTGNGYSYWYSDNGDSYALISGNDKQHVQFSGDWIDGRREELDKARRMAHGDFLWFTHDGKSYLVDDPAIVADLVAAYKPMDELGRQQEELGRKQEELGREQEKMGEHMTQASVPTPDITKEMAALNAAVAELHAAKGKSVTQDQLAELQEKLAEVEGKLGSLQGEIGAREGEIGALQGKLGEQQGVLGEQQGRLGAQQGHIAQEADRKVKSVIDQSLKNGNARPVE